MSTFLERIVDDTESPLIRKLNQNFIDEGRSEGTSFSRYRTVMALSLVEQYVTQLSLREKIFNQGLYYGTDGDVFKTPFFDSQVYENLELFRLKLTEEETYCKPGTLLHYIDHCKTQQGRKLLHKWMDCPPATLATVLERQDAVFELVQN